MSYISVEHHVSNPSSLHLNLPFPVHNKYSLLQPYMRGNDGHTRCAYTPVPHLGLTSASTWLVYMHVTELHVCKCTTWYLKRFFVINATLTSIIHMITWLCENARICALGVQRVKEVIQDHLDKAITALCCVVVRLPDFSKKEANHVWYSPGFYTNPNDFKVCISVYPNRYHNANGTHLLVFINVMLGENDDNLVGLSEPHSL